jgi:predicted molibdopterin-dependent oxidoreductase YjgC
MFKRLDLAASVASHHPVTITVEGRPLSCAAHDTVAAVLLAHGFDACRGTPVSGSPRGPYCMMGVCFDCLVEIDGTPNRQACMTPVRDGMSVRRQDGARELQP